MGSRQSSFKKGGVLNGVTVTIVDYKFTDEFNGQPFEPGRIRGLDGKNIEKPHSLNACLTVRVDGATEDTTQNLRVAKEFSDWEVTDDGHTLSPVEGANLGSSSAWGKFIQSWEAAAGQGAESDAYDEGTYNYEPIIGSRVRLVQQAYNQQELDNLKRLGASEKRKGKDGKEYERQNLVVEAVHELAQAEKKTNGGVKRPTQAATPTSSKTSTSPSKGKAVKTPDVGEEAGEFLVSLLEAAPKNQIERSRLRMKLFTALTEQENPNKDSIIKYLNDDDVLAGLASVSYEAGAKFIELS